jgi:hypothetical protein
MTNCEARTEEAFCRFAESHGCLPLKLRVDGQKGFPDRTVLTRSGVLFVEFKSPTGRCSEHQNEWLDKLRSLGYVVLVARFKGEAERKLAEFLLL